jgi:uncharacterized RDD family membrane protein YckC
VTAVSQKSVPDSHGSEQEYAGQRLGLPEHGSGSVASWGRRIAALLIDWVTSWLVGLLVLGDGLTDDRTTFVDLFGVPLIAVAQTALLVSLAGGSFGQLALRVAVVRLDRRSINPAQSLLRAVLVYLLIPPLVFNRDNRGLHDLAVGTITLKR